MSYIIYFVIIMLIPMYFQHKVKSTYNKYSKVDRLQASPENR